MPFIIGYRYEQNGEWQKDDSHIFAEGNEASEFCKRRNALHKSWGEATRLRVFPLPIDDPLAWRIREKARIDDGTYVLPPWYEKYGLAALEHVDPDDPTKIRFFADEKDAHRNRYTSMAPGRFFIRYINGVPSSGEVEEYCAKMGLDMTVSKLHIGRTADEFEHIYTNGPHSCMAYEYDGEKFDAPFHPVRIYGDLDLGIAYITRGNEITARALVWPDKKIYGRIYGDSSRLKERLKEEGYTEDWDFSGARLHLIRNNAGNIIAPYVDGQVDALIENGYMVLTKNPTVILKCPEGTASTEACFRCGSQSVELSWDEYWSDYGCGCSEQEED